MDIQTHIINKIGIDRLLHIVCAGWIVATLSNFVKLWIALLIGIFLCWLKDAIIDKYLRKSKCDWIDIIAGWFGCIITAFILLFR